MGTKAVRGKVDTSRQDFLGGDESENIKKTLEKVYDELDGDDQEKLEMLKALRAKHEDLQVQLDEAGVELPGKSDEMAQFFEDLTPDQAQVVYNAIRNLD